VWLKGGERWTQGNSGTLRREESVSVEKKKAGVPLSSLTLYKLRGGKLWKKKKTEKKKKKRKGDKGTGEGGERIAIS